MPDTLIAVPAKRGIASYDGPLTGVIYALPVAIVLWALLAAVAVLILF